MMQKIGQNDLSLTIPLFMSNTNMTSPLLKTNKTYILKRLCTETNKHNSYGIMRVVFSLIFIGLKREPAADSADSHQRAFYSAPRIPSLHGLLGQKAQYGVAISYFCPFRQMAPLM